MIWLTWRQFRTQTWIAIGGLILGGLILLLSARSIAHLYSASGAATCHDDCTAQTEAFRNGLYASANGLIYKVSTSVMYVLPPLIGMFWGAPMIARELEAGTHRMVWNQSVTRGRWLSTKLIVIGSISVFTVAVLSLGLTIWARHIDQIDTARITPLPFGARGIVPVGYAAFAFVLGVTLGMLLRRTVPAMASTLGVYVAAVGSMPLLVRSHLLPVHRATPALDTSSITGISLSNDGLRVDATTDIPGAWQLSNHTISPSGRPFVGAVDSQCGKGSSIDSCIEWIGSQNLRLDVRYHSASQFWPLQWMEAGIFFALAAALAWFCVWWTRRRIT